MGKRTDDSIIKGKPTAATYYVIQSGPHFLDQNKDAVDVAFDELCNHLRPPMSGDAPTGARRVPHVECVSRIGQNELT
jgi:hypothetical protein